MFQHSSKNIHKDFTYKLERYRLALNIKGSHFDNR